MAGAVLGLYMGYLLYFLNPQTRISSTRLALLSLIYALIAGLVFGTLLWFAHRLRMRLGGQQSSTDSGSGVGILAVAALVSAIVYWGHVALLRVYLPRTAVQTLSKAGTVVAAAALVLFLLWLIDRTLGQRARAFHPFLAGCLLVMVSWFFISERRAGYRLEPTQTPVTVIQPTRPRPVVVVAIRDLPFDWVVQLSGEDLVPFFSRAPEQSFLTRIEPFPTTSPKTLWASLATGKLPHGHGVTGRYSYQTLLTTAGERFLLVPYWVGFTGWGLVPPVRRISMELPAGDALPFWMIYQRLGYRIAVINWPSSAAEVGDGSVLIDDRTIRQGVRPSLQAAMPRARTIFESLGHQTRSRILSALAADQRAMALLRETMEKDDRIVLAVVWLNGLGEALRALDLEDNRLPPSSTPAGQAIRSYVEHLDGLLATLEPVLPHATLLVASPSAPKPPRLPNTPAELASALVSQQEPGSADGLLLMRGPNINHRENPSVAAVTDVVPTALFAAGLPLARDMDGRPVALAYSEAYIKDHPMSLIPTYEPAQRR